MHLSAWVSLLLNSTAATAIVLVIPRLPSANGGKGFSWWLPLVGIGLIFFSARTLFAVGASPQDSLQALLVGAAVLGGIALKWILAVWASRGVSLRERSLVHALFLSPLSLLCAPTLPQAGLAHLAWWGFVGGFFWQAICDDGVQICSKG